MRARRECIPSVVVVLVHRRRRPRVRRRCDCFDGCAIVGGVFDGPSRGVHATTMRDRRVRIFKEIPYTLTRAFAHASSRTRARRPPSTIDSPRGFLSRSTVVINHHRHPSHRVASLRRRRRRLSVAYLQLGELPRSTSLGPAPAASPAPDLNISPAAAAPLPRMPGRRDDDDARAGMYASNELNTTQR